MSKYKEEILKDIRRRLKNSDPKRWENLSSEQKNLVGETYYLVRDSDYQSINFLLREHANEKRQFIFLVLGIAMGVFANPISSIILKYFPEEDFIHDILTVLFFGFLLAWIVIAFLRAADQSLGDESVIDRLLEIGSSGDIRE